MAHQVLDVSLPDHRGYKSAMLGGWNIQFGRVPEPSAMTFGNVQQEHYSQRRYWLTHEQYPREIFIFDREPEQGRELDLISARVKLDRRSIRTGTEK